MNNNINIEIIDEIHEHEINNYFDDTWTECSGHIDFIYNDNQYKFGYMVYDNIYDNAFSLQIWTEKDDDGSNYWKNIAHSKKGNYYILQKGYINLLQYINKNFKKLIEDNITFSINEDLF